MFETGEFVWLSGYLVSRVSEKSELEEIKNNDMLIGPVYEHISPTAIYRYLDRIVFDEPKAGLVLGYSHRGTGIISAHFSRDSYDDPPEYEGNYLDADQTIRVIMVMPLGKILNRYHTPIAVLPEQLRKME